ncbi:competence protein CoiA [Liquorilactobacillus uvarum]|uniref:competence protein CoiA n=3 Tax=Liquorilactobacillus uvarum TaxID=303240 RepID=UPI00288A8C08|nr:competence protein CoiA family protein [Liquorilactobacillus uvarum]
MRICLRVMQMLIAKSNGKSVLAANANREEQYWCPGCHAELILKKGNFKISHFAHKNRMCQIFSEGETVEHLLGKKRILAAYRKAGYNGELEKHIKMLNQRPDIVVKYKEQKTVVLEFQCAPLSLKKMYERSMGYHTNGLKFCWILGQRYKIKKKLTQQISQFMQWSEKLGFYLLYFDTTRSRFELIFGIQQADFLPLRYYHFYTKSIVELKKFMLKDHQIEYYSLTMEERFKQKDTFLKNCYYSAGMFRKLQELAYKENLRVQEMEPVILRKKYEFPLFYRGEFYWRTEILLQQKRRIHEESQRIQLQGLDNYLFQVPLIDRNKFAKQIALEFQEEIDLIMKIRNEKN